jgi:hypothetical protein
VVTLSPFTIRRATSTRNSLLKFLLAPNLGPFPFNEKCP